MTPRPVGQAVSQHLLLHLNVAKGIIYFERNKSKPWPTSLLEIFGAIWSRMEPYGAILNNLEPFGAIWSHLESFEGIRRHL